MDPIRRLSLPRAAALVALLAASGLLAVALGARAASAALLAPAEGRLTPARSPGLIVGVRDGASLDAVRAGVVSAGGSVLKSYRWNALLVAPPSDTASQSFANALSALPSVRYVERNSTVHALGTANDPLFASQWGLFDIHAPDAWDSSEGSGVAIAEIDSGIDYTHPDLAANARSFYDYVNNDTDAMDDSANGHGTHVAGILAAVRNNNLFGAGTAPRATVYAFKILDATGSGTVANLATAIRDAVDRTPCRIITMSLGQPASETTPGENISMRDAVAYARSKGALVLAATGNGGTNALYYPAGYPGVIGVGSVGNSNTVSAFSNWGLGLVDLVAPGEGIVSTLPGSRSGTLSGTSMATPFVSASAAIVWAAHPSLDATGVEEVLERSAQDLGPAGLDAHYGYGLVRPDAALTATVPMAPTVTIAPSTRWPRLAVPFVLSGVAAPASIGDLVTVYVRKPGLARWSYSSTRLAYVLDGHGGARWWYRYTPRLRGTYSFRATATVAGLTGALSPVLSVSVF